MWLAKLLLSRAPGPLAPATAPCRGPGRAAVRPSYAGPLYSGTVRPSDPPTGNAAATDQSVAPGEATGTPEDIAVGGTGAGYPEPEPARDTPGDRPELPDNQEERDDPDEPGTSAHRAGSVDRPWGRILLLGRSLARGTRRRVHRWPMYRVGADAAFARITVLPAILIMAWLLVGLPLLLAGAFLPAPALLIAVLLAVALGAGLRGAPTRWPQALPGAAAPQREPGRPSWWGPAGTAAVAAGFAFWQFLFNSENVIVLRDPGAYLQTGYWLAQHGSLPIPQALAAFGGSHPGLGFASTGFFASGTSVVPGLMSGLPLILAGAFWVHGTAAAAAMGPILGGLAVLSFGGLAGRLVGPRWAPAGALVLAFTLPEQYTSRGSFSETAAQVLLFGGLSMVVDGLVPGRARSLVRWLTPQRALMALGGLALGLTAVVRFDGLFDVLPAIPFIGILFVRRSAAVVPFCIGLGIGAVYGLADAYLLARPFVDSLHPTPELIALIAAWLAAMTVAGVELLRQPWFRGRLRPVLAGRLARWLPNLAAALTVAALAGLAIRPYLQTVRGPATGAAADFVASLQRLEHLPVDPGRLYAEDTLYWVIWYAGLPAVLLGGFGLALLVQRCLGALLSWRGPSAAVRVWALPLAIICWGSAAVLWRPDIAPDQPWASRRLVPLVLPGLILCAIWASAWLRGRARVRGASQAAAWVVGAFCVAALLVPTLVTTFGLGFTHSGKGGGLRLTADGPALKRTGPGQAGAVSRLCSSLGPAASVVIVDRTVAQEFTQVIRGMCGVPAASMAGQPAGDVQSVLSGIERAGRRPVLLGARPSELYPYGGGSPVRVLDLSTSQDPHTLTQPPTTLSPAHYVIWMSSVGPYATRV
jgi:hypothetical protein